MKRRRRSQLGAVKVTLDRERLREMRSEPAAAKRTAKGIKAAACELVHRAEVQGKRKVFLSDIAAEVGLPMKRLAPIVASLHNLGLITLVRADLPAAMDQRKLAASEIELESTGARYHFVEVDGC